MGKVGRQREDGARQKQWRVRKSQVCPILKADKAKPRKVRKEAFSLLLSRAGLQGCTVCCDCSMPTAEQQLRDGWRQMLPKRAWKLRQEHINGLAWAWSILEEGGLRVGVGGQDS